MQFFFLYEALSYFSPVGYKFHRFYPGMVLLGSSKQNQVIRSFLDYFLDYKNSRNRINARILISTGTIVFHERYDHFSRRERCFSQKVRFFILIYSYYCCTIKEKGKWKSDKCQGEKKLPEVPTVIKDCPLWESALSDWKLSAEINAKRYGSKC